MTRVITMAVILVSGVSLASLAESLPTTTQPPSEASGLYVGLFKVTGKRGTVLIRSVADVGWRIVELGASVSEGNLVQLNKDAVLTVEFSNSEKKQGLSHKVTIKGPIVTRVGRNMLRKINITENFLESVPKIMSQDEAQSRESDRQSLLSMQEAWHRFSAIVSKIKNMNFSATSESDFENVANQSTKFHKILILQPTNPSQIKAKQFPTEINVAWADERNISGGYKIYFWQTNGSRGQAKLMSTTTHATLSVQEPGRYFLQVTSLDQSWQSEPVAIQILPKDEISTSLSASSPHNGFDVKSNDSFQNYIEINFPPEIYQIVTSNSPTPVSFSWYHVNAIHKLPNEFSAHLKIQSQGHIVSDDSLDHLVSMSKPLGEGTYNWWIEIETSTTTAPILSQMHQLTIVSSRTKSGEDFIRSWLTSGRIGTLDMRAIF